MAIWTYWRKIADSRFWYSDSLDWDGPACYELAIAGPRGGNLIIVYVGETRNERSRVIAYASYGSHLAQIIQYHLRQGWCLFYHAQFRQSKAAAVATQNRLLAKYEYDWNIQLNRRR